MILIKYRTSKIVWKIVMPNYDNEEDRLAAGVDIDQLVADGFLDDGEACETPQEKEERLAETANCFPPSNEVLARNAESFDIF